MGHRKAGHRGNASTGARESDHENPQQGAVRSQHAPNPDRGDVGQTSYKVLSLRKRALGRQANNRW